MDFLLKILVKYLSPFNKALKRGINFLFCPLNKNLKDPINFLSYAP